MTETPDKKYALLVPTSMGIRLTPLNSQPFHCSDTFKMQATSAETNVASVASYLGLPVKVLTAFVKDSPVSHFIKDNLKSRRMDFEGPEFKQEDPWGYRHQINMADSGWGLRGPRVQVARRLEVVRQALAEVGRLADVDHPTGGILELVGPRRLRDRARGRPLHHAVSPWSPSRDQCHRHTT